MGIMRPTHYDRRRAPYVSADRGYANFAESPERELPRILIPRTRVNKDGQEPEVRSTTATTPAKAKR
jgi:hypothetical protein